MTLQLRRPCEHGRYEAHGRWANMTGEYHHCPGIGLSDAEALRLILDTYPEVVEKLERRIRMRDVALALVAAVISYEGGVEGVAAVEAEEASE